MNRENKRKQHEKGYYKTHPCDESFTCRNCGYPVVPAGAGSDHRNHCPNCLCSVHLDIEPGDRESDCGGLMEPVAVSMRCRTMPSSLMFLSTTLFCAKKIIHGAMVVPMVATSSDT